MLKILIVEDDISFQNMISRYIEKEVNCVIKTTTKGETTIDLLNKEYFDIYLIDINLEGLVNGVDLLKYIKKDLKLDSEVIVISGQSNIGLAVETIKLGAFDFFEKPISMKKLSKRILEIEEKKKAKNIPLEIYNILKETYNNDLDKKKYKILIIDDDNDCRYLTKTFLEQDNYIIKEANSAKAAYKLLEDFIPDIILLDVMLPDEDGYVISNKLKNKYNLIDIPILMISSKSNDKDIKMGIDKGADDYLKKPYSQMLLQTKTKALLRFKNIISEIKRYSYNLLNQIEEKEKLRKYLSKETIFFNDLTKFRNLEDKKDFIKRYLPEILEIELFSIFLIDQKEKKFKLLTHNHKKLEDEIYFKDSLSSIMYNVFIDKKPILAEDFLKSKFYKGFSREKYRKKSSITFPMKIRDEVIGVINLNNKINGEFDIIFLENLSRIIEYISNSIDNSMLLTKLNDLSIIDELTTIYNRRYFFNEIKKYIEKFNRYQKQFSIILFDIDDFKSINDKYGHINGDILLKKIALKLKNSIRNIDIIARYGGEEFIILLDETDKNAAYETADRLRIKVMEEVILEFKTEKIIRTLSGGVAEYKEDLTVENFINIADNNLYTAKNEGKNRVVK